MIPQTAIIGESSRLKCRSFINWRHFDTSVPSRTFVLYIRERKQRKFTANCLNKWIRDISCNVGQRETKLV